MAPSTRIVACIAAVTLGVTPLVSGATGAISAPSARAAQGITLEASGDQQRMLAGDDASFTLSARNTGSDDLFNLSFSVDVPVGVEFVSSSLGEPLRYDEIEDTPGEPVSAPGTVRWVWQDAADLPVSAAYELGVTVHPTQPTPASPWYTPESTVFPVGSELSLNWTAYASSDPRFLPVFLGSTGVGGATAVDATRSSGPVQTTTRVVSITISKSERSPEAELLRGAHDQTTTFELSVENNKGFQTSDVTVVDYLPAGLEFLGCGLVDNGSNQSEYSGSPSLAGTAALAPLSAFGAGPNPSRDGCLLPDSVETIAVLAAPSGSSLPSRLDPGVYTKVVWSIGDLPPGSRTIIRYAAAVPLYENTVTWTGATPSTTPTAPGSLAPQAANLDNNTGGSTRHGDAGSWAYSTDASTRAQDDGDSWTNSSRVDGTFDGMVRAADAATAGGMRAVFDEADHTIDAMDLAIVKTVSTSKGSGGSFVFVPNEAARFTLRLRTGEYASAAAVRIRDTVRNGLCPLVPLGTTTSVVGPGSYPAECAPGSGTDAPEFAPIAGALVESVEYDSTSGRFTMLLSPTFSGGGDTMSPNATHQITYPVLMRSSYELASEFGPTTSGDSFRNLVDVSGTTSLRPEVAGMAGQLGDQDVWDDSGASIGSELTTITKQILPREAVDSSASPCAAAPDGAWRDGLDVGSTPSGFRMGDTVCYRLTVAFPNIATRNPVVADFLPAGVSYSGSEVAAGDGVSAAFDTSAAADGRLQWLIGDVGVGGDRYVAAGSTLHLLVWGTINAPAADRVADKLDNLMKYRQESVDGAVYFLRDSASFLREPGITLVKGVRDVDDVVVPASGSLLAGDQFGSNRDHLQVVEGSVVTYRIDLTGLQDDITGVAVWDALPSGVDCADLVPNSFRANDVDLGTDPACSVENALHPASLNGRSVVKWSGVTIPAGSTQTLTYDLTIPAGTSVETKLDNVASIVAMDSGANGGAGLVYFPEDSLDAGAVKNYPGGGLVDASDVFLPPVVVAKSATSTIEAANGATQAVVGELIEYTYSVTIPANTTVFNGSLSDSLPAGLQRFAGFAPTATLDGAALPADMSVDSNGTLTFPAAYSSGGSARVAEVTIKAFLTNIGGNSHGVTRDNRATFTSTKTTDAASGNYTRTADATVTVVTPAPNLDKVVSKVDGAAPVFTGGRAAIRGSSVVEYTLTITNPAARPTSYGTVLTDCVPAALSDIVFTTVPAGAVTGSCAAGGTALAWPEQDVAPGQTVTVKYTATVDSDAAGLATYTNTAAITGYTLDAPESGVRGTLTDTDDAIVRMTGATVAKTASRSNGTIGDGVTYTLKVTLPANVSFYDAYLEDTVPAGIRVLSATVTDAAGLTIGAPSPATTAGQTATKMKWLVSDGNPGGDIPDAAAVRVFQITYDAMIVDSRLDRSAGSATPVAGGSLVNTANFYWNVTDETVGTRIGAGSKTATVTVWEPKLTIAKKVGGQDALSVKPGATPFTYSVTVTNAPTATTSTAHDVVVRDVIPPGVIVDESSINNPALPGVTFTTETADGVITAIQWSISAIAKSSATILTYRATLEPSDQLTDGQTFTNTASITEYHSLPATDPNAAERRDYLGGSDSAVVTAVFPALSVVKTPAAGPAYIGQAHQFTVTISNPGGAAATTVKVVDTLPTGWTYVAGTATLGGSAIADPAVSSQTLTWADLGDIAAGASIVLRYSALPDALHAWDAANTGSTVPHTNSVTVTAQDESGLPGNASRDYTGSATASATINRADLVIDKSHSGSVIAGVSGGLTWTLRVSNAGPDAAVGPIVVTDTVPSGVSVVSATGTGWSVTGPVAGEYTFTRAGPLASGASLPPISIVATVPSTTEAGTTIVNTAQVQGKTFETQTANNADTDTVTVSVEADLELVKSVDATAFVAGEDADWTILVTNHGPSVARGPITVTDTLPTGIGTAVAFGTGWTCAAPDSGSLTCVHVGDLAVNASAAAITVTTPVLSSTLGAIYNTATVSGPTPEPAIDPHANTDVASVNPVGSEADLELQKSLVSESLKVGSTARYRVEVTNHGPSDALDVTVLDDLPAGLSFVASSVTSDSALNWTCTATTVSQLDCELEGNLGTLEDGASTWFEFDVTIRSDVHGAVVNRATASSTTVDPDSTNNVDVASTLASIETSVSIEKDTTATVVQGGDEYDYTIQVRNDGVADVENLVVTDELPDELRFRSATLATAGATAPNWTDPCLISGQDSDGNGGTIVCELDGPLVAGAAAPLITIAVTVAADAYATTVDNTASVKWTDLGSPAVNTASDSVSTPLKWIHYTGNSECVADVPWFDYELTTSANVDTSSLPITIEWYKDADGDGVQEDPASTESDPVVNDPSAGPVSVYTIAAGASVLTTDDGREFPVTVSTTAAGRTLTGAVLWPGAKVDAAGVGIAWPGWRVALPTETPTWENLLYDETLPGANLRGGALVVIQVNPTTNITASYPPATAACTVTRIPELTIQKTASVQDAGAGERFNYTLEVASTGLGATNDVVLVDQVPAELKVLDVIESAPADPTIAPWNDCTVTAQDADGYGGVVTCVLDGYLGADQSAPPVIIDVELTTLSRGETVVNHASVAWTDPDDEGADGLQLATASINEGWLARTGIGQVAAGLAGIMALLCAGGVLLLTRARRTRRSES